MLLVATARPSCRSWEWAAVCGARAHGGRMYRIACPALRRSGRGSSQKPLKTYAAPLRESAYGAPAMTAVSETATDRPSWSLAPPLDAVSFACWVHVTPVLVNT